MGKCTMSLVEDAMVNLLEADATVGLPVKTLGFRTM